MISKIGKVYGVELNQTAVLSFLGSMGATVVGSTLATLIPIAAMQIPIGVSVTYGVGKAAQRWIKDGMPDDTRPYKEVFEEEKANGEKDEKELEANPKKDEPLGDEKKDFTKELKKSWNDIYPERAHNTINQLADPAAGQGKHFRRQARQCAEEGRSHGRTDRKRQVHHPRCFRSRSGNSTEDGKGFAGYRPHQEP